MEIIKTAEGWQTAELSSLVVEEGGVQTGPFGSQLHQKDYVDEGTPIITVEHLGDNRILHNEPPCVSDSDRDRLSKYSLKSGDIVFSRVGSVDRRALVRDGEDGWLFSGRCLRVRTQPEKIDSAFLSYYLGHESVKNYIRAVAVGATMPSINTKILSQLPVSYPPILEDQKAIAHILGTLDDKIELNQKMNHTLEEIAKAIFKSWFVDFDPVRAKAEGRPTGLPSEISDLFPDELVDSEIGEIPKGWDVFKVKDEAIRLKVGKLYSNKTVEEEGSIPVLDQSDSGIIGYHSNDQFVSASLENPVFTFANHTCKMRLLFSDFGVIQNVIPMQSKSYPTIWFYLRTLDIKKFEEYKGHMPDFMDTQLCFPSVPLAKSLNQLVTPLFHRIEIAKREIKVLSELRDTLLPKLISGELRIPDAEKFLEEAGV